MGKQAPKNAPPPAPAVVEAERRQKEAQRQRRRQQRRGPSFIGKDAKLRAALLVTLLVSDADFFFTLIFMDQLRSHTDSMFHLFFGLMVIALFSYFAGVLHLGPRQKRKIPKLVLEFMEHNPTQLLSKIWIKNPDTGRWRKRQSPADDHIPPSRVSLGDPLDPENPNGNSFCHLKPKELVVAHSTQFILCCCFAGCCGREDEEAAEEKVGKKVLLLKNALLKYELPIMEIVSAKNAFNVVKAKQGLPFWRTAAYGFQAELSPIAFCGILNANGMFTITCGMPNILAGLMMLFFSGSDDASPAPALQDRSRVIIPMIVSSISLALSIINVFFEFSRQLIEMNAEKQLQQNIESETWADLERSLGVAQRERNQALQKLNETFQEEFKEEERKLSASGGTFNQRDFDLKKSRHLDAVDQSYQMAVRDAQKAFRRMVEVRLTEYRRNRELLRTVRNGNQTKDGLSQEDEFDGMKELNEALRAQSRAADQGACRQILEGISDVEKGFTHLGETKDEDPVKQLQKVLRLHKDITAPL